MISAASRAPAGLADLAYVLAQAARLAPSVHNTQPWTFTALPDGLAIRQDPDRALPSLDPHGRLRTISCGAAVANAALALAHEGRRPRVELLPDDDGTLLATVRRGELADASADDERRYAAIPVRRAHRRLHQSRRVAPGEVETLREAVVGAGARAVVPAAAQRRQFAGVLRTAARHQLADPAHLAEVSQWIRHLGGVRSPDGIPVASLGTTPFPSDSLVYDGWDDDELEQAPLEDDLEASTVLAIATASDSRRDWLVAGVALQTAWLQATTLDLAVTFADQATQWAGSREQAAAALGAPGALQVVLRVGYPLVDVPPTPRRELAHLWR